MMQHLLTTVAAITYVHVYLDQSEALSFTRSLKPRGEGVFTGAHRHARACADLTSGGCAGAIVQLDERKEEPTSCVYVLRREEACDTVQVVSMFWQTQRDMMARIRVMRRWYADRFWDELTGAELDDGVEQDLWWLSEIDP